MSTWIERVGLCVFIALSAWAVAGAHAEIMSAAQHAAMHTDAQAPAVSLKGASQFQVQAPLIDQLGMPLDLARRHSAATVFTMFYGDCQYACPIIIENLKRTLAQLPEVQRAQLHVVMISLNAGVDTPASLSTLMKTHKLDPTQFTFAVSDTDTHTRQWAAALGIKYRRAANGEINHSTRLVLADESGVPIAQSDTLSVEPDPEFLLKVKTALH